MSTYADMVEACGGPPAWMNIAELDVVGGPRQKSYTPAEVAAKLAAIAPTVEALQAKGWLNSSYIYGFDEAPREFETALRQLFGGVKKRWPALRTVAVLNWDASGGAPADLPLDVWVTAFWGDTVSDIRGYNKTQAEAWMASGAAPGSTARRRFFPYYCCQLRFCRTLVL